MRNDGSTLLDRLSKKTVENLLFAGMAAVLVIGACVHVMVRAPQNSADTFIALNADGSLEGQLHMSFVWPGPAPLQEMVDHSSVALVENHWTDGKGRTLDVNTEPEERGGYQIRVRSPEPVFPKERVEWKAACRTVESAVRRDGDDYVFHTYPSIGNRAYSNKPYLSTYTVTLPKGAKVVSTLPETEWSCTMDEKSVLHFKWTVKPGSHPELLVKYSLPQA